MRKALGWLPLTLLLALPACSDRWNRDGTWRATGVNDQNLHAMVAYPSDLSMGQSSPDTNGQLAAAAVDRLLHDRVKQLPGGNISQVGAGSVMGGSSGGAPAPAGSGGS